MSEPSSNGLFTSLLLAFRDFAQPVLDSFTSYQAMEYFWYQFGWRVTLDDVAAAAIKSALPIGASAQQLETVTDAIRDAMESGSAPSIDDLAKLAGIVTDLADGLATYTPSATTSLPAPLNDPASWEDIAEQLFDALLERYLRIHRPVIYLVLLTTGCIDYQHTPAAPPWRVAYTRSVFDWDQLQALLHDPVTALTSVYHWDDPAAPFDHPRLLDSLDRVLSAIGLATDRLTPGFQLEPGLPADVAAKIRADADALRVTLLQGFALADQATYAVGFDLLTASDIGAAAPTGLVLRPRLVGGVADPIPLGTSVALTFSVAAGVGDVLGVEFFPGNVGLTGGDVTIGTSVGIAATGPQPWYALGTSTSARVELHSPTLTVSFEDAGTTAELRIKLATSPGTANPGCKIVVPLDGADAFVQDCARQDAIELSFTPELIWSSASGFSFNGSPTPQFNVPLSLNIGTFSIQNVKIGVADGPALTSKPSFALQVAVNIAGSIGPLALSVQGIGFALDVIPYSHQDLLALPPGASRPALGNLDLGLQFLPPTGAGMSVDADIVAGGGFLSRDPSSGRYAGVLDLRAGEIDITAIGLLDTQLPAGQGGYALVMLLSATFPGVEIGFGFALTGVGGLLALNRSVDVDALRARLTAGTAGRILAPQDPIRNAPALLADLDAVFPVAPGVTVVGPTVQLVWAGLVNFDVGVFIELPGPTRVVLLGSAYAEIEQGGRAYLSIRVDILGVVDLRGETAAFDAVLINSHLMGMLDLTGGAAMRLSWGAQPYAVLTLGGFNPAYNPAPLSFPASLARIAMVHGKPADQVYLRFEGYFAVTGNTLQFGAAVEAAINDGDFAIHGSLAFDALIQFEPFHFEFDLHASVSVSYKGDALAGLSLTGSLTGPGPVVLKAKVCIELLFFDICYSGTYELGPFSPPPLPTAPDLFATLLTELTDPTRLRAAGGTDPLVRLQPPDPTLTTPVVDPTGTLVWEQHRAPLDLLLTRIGGTPIPSPVQVNVSCTGSASPQSDWFAPGQFLNLTDDQALTQPGYELLTSGLRLAGTGSTDGPSAQATLSIHQIRLPLAATKTKPVIMLPGWILTSTRPAATPAITVTTESWILTTPGGQRSGLSGAQARQLAVLTPDARAIPATDQLAAVSF